MINDFYTDLKDYEVQLLKEKYEVEKNRKEQQRGAPKWHREQTSNSKFNPVESIEKERNEPNKPLN